MMAAENPSTVTLLDIYTRQVQLDSKVDVIHEQLKAIPDHEDRIRALERWRYALPMSLVLAVLSAAVTLVGWRYGGVP